ncbi:4Fe-4S dicluster domain-containing protein [Chloroflexota bacterium]
MAEKNAEKKEWSRRNFLQLASGTAAGVVFGGALYTLVSSGDRVYAEVPVSEGYLVHDSTKCATCQSCMLACSLAHEGKENTTLSRIQILQNTFNRFPDTVTMSVCRQCVNPLCVQVCPTHACHVDTDNGNVRVIDESKCIGCQTCIQACPFIPHRTIWNAEKNVAMKCDLCINTPYWSETGGPDGKQLCVEVCPMEALEFVKNVPSQTDNVGYDVNLREGV